VTSPAADTSTDRFLGGLIEVLQPLQGHHRSGLEAAILAASLPADTAGVVVDAGAGAGVVGLAVAARCAAADVLLVEREEALVALSQASLGLPGNRAFADRVAIARLDITADEATRIAAGVRREGAIAVLMNPPFYSEAAATSSPSPERAAAHSRPTGLEDWFRFAAWALRPDGRLVVILQAEALPELLAGTSGRFGALDVLPIHPRADGKAARVLVRAVKGSRSPLALLPGLVLHEDGKGFRPDVDALLRGKADLAEIHPAWRLWAGGERRA
jgi:tRNA1(Val) A37 N6-methylase TrmN6